MDNGLEFCSSEFDDFFKDQGIARHRTVRNTPQQNGVAERMNQTLLARARCMLSNAGLARRFWSEAVATACYLINRSPHTGIGCKTPFEVWSRKAADYSDLRVFGCVAYYHVDDGKLEPTTKKGVFMGYGTGVKGYRIWSDNKVILSRSVVFDESSMLRAKNTVEIEIGAAEKKVEASSDPNDPKESETPSPTLETVEQEAEGSEDASPEEPVHQSIATGRPKRVIKPPTRYMNDGMVGYTLQVAEEVEDEPSTYKAAISSSESAQWIAAMGEEMESLSKKSTWELVKLPVNRKVVTCKWVFKKKEGVTSAEASSIKQE